MSEEPSNSTTQPIYYLLIALFGVAIVLQFWTGYHVPTQDGPIHAYYGHALRSYLQGTGNFLEMFEFASGLPPYLLTHFSLAVLDAIFGAVNGERVFVTLICLFSIGSWVYLSQSFDKSNAFLCLVGLCFVSSQLLFLGFYNYCLAVSFFGFSVGYWIRHCSDFHLRGWIVLSALFGLIYISHPVVFFAALLVVFVTSLVANVSGTQVGGTNFKLALKQPLTVILAGLPWMTMMAVYAFFNGSEPSSFPALSDRLRWLVRFEYMSPFDANFLPLAGMTLLVFAIVGVWFIRLRGSILKDSKFVGLIFAAVLLGVGMLVVPKAINGAGYLPNRFPILILICLIAWLATFQYRESVKKAIAAVSVFCLLAMMAANHYGLNRIGALSEDEFDPTLWAAVAPNSVIRIAGTNSDFISENIGNFTTIGRGGFYLAAEKNSTVIMLDKEFATTHFPLHLKEKFRRDSAVAFDPESYREATGVPIDYIFVYDSPENSGPPKVGFDLGNYELIHASKPLGYIKLFKLRS